MILTVLGVVVLLGTNEAAIIAYIGIASSTLVSLLNLVKIDSVKSHVQELTNGKMTEAVNTAVNNAINPKDDKADKG